MLQRRYSPQKNFWISACAYELEFKVLNPPYRQMFSSATLNASVQTRVALLVMMGS
jgi:hypothetical protein